MRPESTPKETDHSGYVGNVDPADVTHPNSVWGLAPRCQQVTVLHEISEGLLHLAGVEHYAGKTWQPSDEAAQNSNWAKFAD